MTYSTRSAAESWIAGVPAAPAAATGNSSSEQAPTVFVVDDDVSIRTVLCLLMESEGVQTEPYPDARTFLDAYDPDRPGCVLLDVCMPGMSGIELQQHLASEAFAPPIIFLTGKNDVPTAIQALRTGAVDFIQKPFRAQLLVDCVQEAIARDRENRRMHLERQELESRRAHLTARSAT